jgi:transcriptional regulator with XRE-family HTH domain
MQSGADGLYLEIGRVIKQFRLRRAPKMSQQGLADAVGMSRASIANIERGLHRVQLHVLYDIATALDVEPHDLLPHQDQQQQSTRVPKDVREDLSAKEQAAVDRLLRSGKTQAKTNE